MRVPDTIKTDLLIQRHSDLRKHYSCMKCTEKLDENSLISLTYREIIQIFESDRKPFYFDDEETFKLPDEFIKKHSHLTYKTWQRAKKIDRDSIDRNDINFVRQERIKKMY
jgi:hypothetical protein